MTSTTFQAPSTSLEVSDLRRLELWSNYCDNAIAMVFFQSDALPMFLKRVATAMMLIYIFSISMETFEHRNIYFEVTMATIS